MIRTLIRPSLLLACVLASGCGPAPVEPAPSPKGTHTQALRWPKWIRIAAADIKGAAQGAELGGAIGGIAGPEGAVIGSVVGAVVLGAQASIEAASRQTTTDGVISGSRATIDPSNARNPFDHVGQHHNEVLDQQVSIIGPGGCIPNPFPFPFPRDRTQGPLWDYALKTLNSPPELLKDPKFEEGWHDSLDFVAAAEEEEIEASIQNRVKSGKMSPAVGEQLISYFTAVAPLDTDRLIETTKSFEEKTLAANKLAEEDRRTLLSAFSVARYSAVYWAEHAALKDASPWCGCK